MSNSPVSNYVGYDLVLIPISAAIGFAIWFGLNRTITGKIVLAVIHNEENERQHGRQGEPGLRGRLCLRRTLASLAGALTAPKNLDAAGSQLGCHHPEFRHRVIGGLGSVEGAAVGAFLSGSAARLSD